MTDESTKFFSTKQEKMIAKYLGWKTVPASGARDFNKGDVVSEDFLAECKTHTSEVSRIKIDFRVWLKLKNEATSQMRSPVLFVDNGTQTESGTWAVVQASSIPMECDVPLEDGPKSYMNQQSISFVHQVSKNPVVWIYNLHTYKERIAIMSLRTFRHMFLVGDI